MESTSPSIHKVQSPVAGRKHSLRAARSYRTRGNQVKATDHLKRLAGGQTISWRIESAHLHHWLNEPMPVILVVYDAQQDEAYWLYVQKYFEEAPTFWPSHEE